MNYFFRLSGVLKKHESIWIVLVFVVGWIVCCAGESKKWTIGELTALIFPKKVFNDIRLDPYKSDRFMGDIALSRLENDINEKELEVEEERKPENEVSKLFAKRSQNAIDLDSPISELRSKRHSYKKRRKRSTKAHNRPKRAATADPERLWDNGVIPYEIESIFSVNQQALFKQAMRYWENYTCIQFVEREEHTNYIVFTVKDGGCLSLVGKEGKGPQYISIAENCDKLGIVLHELGHVVGFWHEHTRPDRDKYVHICGNNIMMGEQSNFFIKPVEEVNSYGFPYDYASIMHYGRNFFSINPNLDTIVPVKDPQGNLPEIGQSTRLSEGDIAQTNFLYKCPKCGKTLQNPSGAFSSPDYGSTSTPDAKHCDWRISVTQGERIILNITDYDLFKSKNCEMDYLEVRDGYSYKSPLLGKFCGKSKAPRVLIGSKYRMLVTYRTSRNHVSHKGFKAHYKVVCGGDVVQEKGVLRSPNYPEDYSPNTDCTWRITVPENHLVVLKFEFFEIEHESKCLNDYLEIRDGHESRSPLLGRFCGFTKPNRIQSSGNKMTVKFVSDESEQRAGFVADFIREWDECKGDHGCEHMCTKTLGGYKCKCRRGYKLQSNGKNCEDLCGGVIKEANGTIISPSSTDIYPPNEKCIWDIIAPPEYRIVLNFTHFDLEGENQTCGCSRLDILSIADDEVRNHGVFSGSRLPPLITSEGNSLRIIFKSDKSLQKGGFSAYFFTVKDECAEKNGGCQHICKNTIGSYACSCHNGFVLQSDGHNCKEGNCSHQVNSSHSEFISPNYPGNYPSKQDCDWLLTTTPGHRIKLVFKDFELESEQECAYDHIVTYDGNSSESPTLGKFCGSKMPQPIVASGNRMYLVFKSDSAVHLKGFKATYITVCGGRLLADRNIEHLYSHTKYGKQKYNSKAYCDWIVQGLNDRRVKIQFPTFEVEHEKDCGYDYVEVYDGEDDSAKSFGKFCGNKVPPEFFSSGDSLMVRFRSDETINAKGFSVAYASLYSSKENDDDIMERLHL